MRDFQSIVVHPKLFISLRGYLCIVFQTVCCVHSLRAGFRRAHAMRGTPATGFNFPKSRIACIALL